MDILYIYASIHDSNSSTLYFILLTNVDDNNNIFIRQKSGVIKDYVLMERVQVLGGLVFSFVAHIVHQM